MPKNILIFSDSTGQAGGISFDERRSNIYKLYRATRVGPDSVIATVVTSFFVGYHLMVAAPRQRPCAGIAAMTSRMPNIRSDSDRMMLVFARSFFMFAIVMGSWQAAYAAESIREETMLVTEFNRQIINAYQNRERWTFYSKSIALKFIGTTCCPGDTCSCQTRVIAERASGRFSKLLTITDQGAPDDSVRGFRYRISMTKLPQRVWQLDRAGRSWNCWPGRGHQDFSTEPCR